ncbi:APC family permease [Halococcus agarilyticus]|uniref:APC family permease n=1 Tax=Halococcus agarilyticus TaxID=1232219 RepID=UPI0006779DD3|nr:APC family permease [Halococcus agarilyticus]
MSGESVFEGELGTLDCVLLSLGGMVGSAIFVFPGSTGRLTGPSAVGAWLVAGVLMLAIALCYTELALAFPETGAVAVFPYETLGPSPAIRAFASYLEGVCYTVGWVFGISVSALAIADYLAILVPAAGGHVPLVALVAIGAATLVNLLGVDVTSRANLLLSALLLAVLCAFVASGFARFRPSNYEPFFAAGPVRFFAAVQVALTAYGAWTAIPSVVEEIETPSRTVPRAILVSLAAATLLYTAIVAAVHGVVPIERFAADSAAITAPLGVAAGAIGLPWLRSLLAFGAVIAIFTTLLVGVMSAGRVLFALGRNDTLPRAFAATSGFRVPWVGVLAVGVVAGALVTVPGYFSQLLVVAAVVGTGVPYALNILSFVGLRHYRTDIESPFRAPGGDALAIVAFAGIAVAMIGLGSTEIRWSLGALAVLIGSFVLRAALVPDAIEPETPTDS